MYGSDQEQDEPLMFFEMLTNISKLPTVSYAYALPDEKMTTV
jgi:hypothetical protein